MSKAKMSRFEEYVKERVTDELSGEREKLRAAFDAEVAKVNGKAAELQKALEKAFRRTIVDVFGANGIDATHMAPEVVHRCVAQIPDSLFGVQREYYDHDWHWPRGTAHGDLEAKIIEFDRKIDKIVRRIVVYRTDLGVKAAEFEKMLEDTVKNMRQPL